MARSLKFRIQKVEGLYYPCSENKGADQLRGYREVDLRLCFRICKKPVFSRCGSYVTSLERRKICFCHMLASVDTDQSSNLCSLTSAFVFHCNDNTCCLFVQNFKPPACFYRQLCIMGKPAACLCSKQTCKSDPAEEIRCIFDDN